MRQLSEAQPSAPRQQAKEVTVKVETEMHLPPDASQDMLATQQKTAAILLAWEVCDTHAHLRTEVAAIRESLQTCKPRVPLICGALQLKEADEYRNEYQVLVNEDDGNAAEGRQTRPDGDEGQTSEAQALLDPAPLRRAPETDDWEVLFGPIPVRAKPPTNPFVQLNPFADLSSSDEEDIANVRFAYLHPRVQPVFVQNEEEDALLAHCIDVGRKLLQVQRGMPMKS